jgi:hypothetical protein
VSFYKNIFLFFLYAIIENSAAGAQSLTTNDLQNLLKSAPKSDKNYHEQRQSPWLSSPTYSRGIIRILPQGLEKQVDSPKREIWRLLHDHLEWVGQDSIGSKKIFFSNTPSLAVLSNAMRRLVIGDLKDLESDFQIITHGEMKMWTVRLQPIGLEINKYLDYLEMKGSGTQIQVLIVVERKGERTTTYFQP